MKTYPILFSTEMVQALLEGRKTQTRRIIKPHPNRGMELKQWDYSEKGFEAFFEDGFIKELEDVHPTDYLIKILNKLKKGDVLWVRETFCFTGSLEYLNPETKMPFFYKTDCNDEALAREIMREYNWKFRPSIHMPKAACRIFLEITNIRVERLHDITDEDAIAEGIERVADFGSTGFKLYTDPNASHSDIDAKWSFESLWQSINGEDSWNENPWVWVIEFKRIDKPENF